MDNEAQAEDLAGYEITHAINRHGLKEYTNIKSKKSSPATLSVVGAWVGAGIFGAAGTMAVTGYSRELETEADMEGLARMVKADMTRPSQLPFSIYWKRKRKRKNIKESFFFGSHPRIQERKETAGHPRKRVQERRVKEPGGLRRGYPDVVLDSAGSSRRREGSSGHKDGGEIQGWAGHRSEGLLRAG